MSDDETIKEESETREFTENPYDHQNARPEDVVRLFYLHDVPVIPVISKRGILIGILKKQSIISELSDIERVQKLKIDEFITRNAVRMNFDDLLPYGKIREFVVINIFGELQGKWSRVQPFTACESAKSINHDEEVKKQQEDQVLDWMIYLILEHIPRALYAVNEKGKTIFYNSHFEDHYVSHMGADVNVETAEKLLSDPMRNELYSSPDGNDFSFFNDELDLHYEKIPLMSGGKKSGFLFFCDKTSSVSEGLNLPGFNCKDKSLQEVLDTVEGQVIVDSIRMGGSMEKAAELLKISKQSLGAKMKKLSIDA